MFLNEGEANEFLSVFCFVFFALTFWSESGIQQVFQYFFFYSKPQNNLLKKDAFY